MLLAGVLAFVVAQLVVGLVVSRRIATEDDYLVAGRRIGPLFCAMSIFATWFGAESCVGAAGQIYEHGLTRTSVEPFAYGACLLLAGLLFARALWRTGITTLADLHRRRYGPGIERLAALLLIPTSVLWAAAQVRAFGHVLETSSALDFEAALAIAALIAIAYTVAGGLLADIYTDVVQGALLVGGLGALLLAVVGELGGAGATLAALDLPALFAVDPAGPDLLATIEAWAVPICGSVVAQEVVSRMLAARSPEVARGATLAGGAAYLLVGLVPVTLGLLGARLLPGLDDPEKLLPELARTRLSRFEYVVFAGALVSAILSTVDSTLLVASSLLSRNLVLAGRPATDERRRLAVARWGVAGFGLLAWALAHGAEGVFALVEEASAFGSAGILVITIAALCGVRGGARAAGGALLAGVVAWLVGAHVLALAHPYLVSLGAACAGFALGALLDRGARGGTMARA